MKRLIILLLFFSSACSQKALIYLNEEGAKFQDFKTYRLINTKLDRTNLSKEGRDILDILEAAIKNEMNKRGYEESNLSPDLVLRYEISTSRHTNSQNNISPYGAPPTTRTFLESLIILDLTDTERRKMFWQSSYDLRQESRQLKKEHATQDAVSEIFYTFPFRAGESEPDPTLSDRKANRKIIKALRKIEKKEAKELEKEQKKNR